MLRIRSLVNYFKFKSLKKNLYRIGNSNDISPDIRIHYPERVMIDSYIYIGPNAEINGLGGVDIKAGVIIGPNLIIHSANHNYKDPKYLPYDETFDFKKVTICENVWIGGNVIMTPGSYVGEGSVVGSGCVVSGKIPPLSILIGNPCRVISKRNKENYEKLKKEGRIYIKYKLKGKIVPQYNEGYYEG